MRTTRPFLAGVTMMIGFAGVAVAQEPPEGEAPAQGDYPPQGEAPPPTYAPQPAYQPPPPPENPPPPPPAEARFGAAGQIAISDDLRVVISRQSQSSTNFGSSSSSSSYQLQPALDYFVAPSFSIGAELSLAYFSSSGASSTVIGLTPRVGYDFSLSSVVSIWPRVGLGYTHTSSNFSNSFGSDQTSYAVIFEVFVPVVFHPAPHFFLGGGPYISTYLVSKVESSDAPKLTDSGLMSVLGGYFGGP